MSPVSRITSEAGNVVLTLVVFVVVVAGGFLFALNYHVITTSKGTIIIPKTAMSLSDTFVDVRRWGWVDLWAHRETVAAMVKAGHGREIPQVESFNNAIHAGVKTLEEFNARFGVSERLRNMQQGIQRFDERYGISEKVETAGEKLREFEEKHQIKEKVREGVEKAAESARGLFRKFQERR